MGFAGHLRSNSGVYGGSLIHPDEERHLTIPELKRVASFPDAFEVLGAFQQQWAQIGNSVPPGMMRAVAVSLVRLLQSSASVSLGA